jgi:hypothetical protein
MGKAARNERRKITAAYFNSIAVAFFAAGVAVPRFYVMSKTKRLLIGFYRSRQTTAFSVD